MPRSRCTRLQFSCTPLASRTSESRSWTEPSRGWLLPHWHCSCPQMASLGVGRKASRVGRSSIKVPTNSGACFLHLPRCAGHVAAIGAAPTAPKGITPSIGCLEAKWCGRLGSRSPKRLALLGIGGTAPVHTHSLSTSTRLTVPQSEVRGALGTISWAELRQITVVSARAALPVSWLQLWRVANKVGAGQIQPGAHLAGELWGGWSRVDSHLAVLTTGSIGCTLCSWPQLAGEVVTARVRALLQARGQRELSHGAAAAFKTSQPPREQTQGSKPTANEDQRRQEGL